MPEVSRLRLFVLRAMYLFIVVGLTVFFWPAFLASHASWDVAESEALCMLCAFSLLCLLGVRYPLKLLPVLLWEVLWKTLWLLRVPLPQYLHGGVDPTIAPVVFSIGMVALVYLAVPWRYVFQHYVRAPAERWR